jgi:hypothetical protein
VPIRSDPPTRAAGTGRPLVIIHLMKTGGFSLLYQVLANVGRPAVWGAPGPLAGASLQLSHYTSVERLRTIDDEVRSSIEVVIGHLPLAVVDVAGFHEATIATVVREPVSRVVSLLAMFQASYPEHRDRSLEEIFEDEYFGPRMVADHQTKMLGMTAADATVAPPRVAGPPNPAIVEELIAGGYFGTTQYAMEILDTPLVWPVPVDRSTLDRARQNLDRVAVLGVHERYDEFLASLAAHTGWTIDRTIRANQGPSPAISASFRRRIEAGNALDLELHAHACDLVHRRSTPG